MDEQYLYELIKWVQGKLKEAVYNKDWYKVEFVLNRIKSEVGEWKGKPKKQ